MDLKKEVQAGTEIENDNSVSEKIYSKRHMAREMWYLLKKPHKV